MQRPRLRHAVVASCLAAATLAHSAGAAFGWPHGEKAAVSLAYDDAIDSQLDNAIPALDRAGLKGSFYLTLANPSLRNRLDEWRAAAAHGHELGNHTLFHFCSAKAAGHEWVTPELDLDTVSAARMVAQVKLANTLLHAIDGRTARTFTVPCGDRRAQDGDYVDLVKSEFVAIKSGPGAVVADMDTLDPYAVGVTAPEGATGAQLIALVEQAARAGTMINFTFHGIGGDYITTSRQAHEELLAYLAAHRDVYWTDTFMNIMTYVKARQAAHRTTP
ncbi:polysaccharide deacetylase family protein [Scleromatobacter humisilvae]|uniref:Polysaccharide deacetylase family protein n=1 Tax=Scleromatobacter humisilvae TaxID=2897159 RepID=A0A9X2C0E9_9BURK|nr:polysaccharide deacetylase family protein [Scleromatobacter humisilvae]MCK9687257.1 polysaccharide deacetylase family protein [Scleromatobacter humisilvae]